MKVLSLCSRVGGSGRTTLAAQLAEILHRGPGPDVAVLELDPQNVLGLYLGQDVESEEGWYHRLRQDQPPMAGAFESDSGLRFLPFGSVAEAEHLQAPAEINAHVSRLLESISAVFDGWLLVDTPRQVSAWASAALDHSTLVLNLLRADAHSLATHVRQAGPPDERQLWLLNQFEPAQPLQADLHVVWRDLLGAQLLPETVHRDRALTEVLAARAELATYSPNSQAMHDLHGVARRLLGYMQA